MSKISQLFGILPTKRKIFSSGNAIIGTGATNTQSYGYQIAQPPFGFINSAYGNNKFVTCTTTTSQTYYMNSGGTIWTAGGTLPTSQINTMIAFGAGLFVIIQGSDNTTYFTSPDGATWTSRTLTNYSNVYSYITFVGGLFFLYNNAARLLTSTDGINWTLSAILFTNTVCYTGGLYIATVLYSKTYYTSPTAANGTWTTRTINVGTYNVNYLGSALSSSSILAAYLTNYTSIPYLLFTTSDGITWTYRADVGTYMGINQGGYFSPNFVIWYGSYVLFSSDGISWKLFTMPSTILAPGIYMISGGNGLVFNNSGSITNFINFNGYEIVYERQ
jgi:hypothetical protein